MKSAHKFVQNESFEGFNIIFGSINSINIAQQLVIEIFTEKKTNNDIMRRRM